MSFSVNAQELFLINDGLICLIPGVEAILINTYENEIPAFEDVITASDSTIASLRRELLIREELASRQLQRIFTLSQANDTAQALYKEAKREIVKTKRRTWLIRVGIVTAAGLIIYYDKR